jgi:hypothetical protein
MMELHLKETVEDMLNKLLINEDQYKELESHNQKHLQGKQLKNPYRFHKGGHEWDDCRENLKNNRNNEQRGRDNNRDNHDNNRDNRNGNNNRRLNREEFRRTKNRNEEHTHNYD